MWIEDNQRTEDGERDATLIALKMEEGDLEPKNEDDFKKLKKARKCILSQSLQKELRTAKIFSPHFLSIVACAALLAYRIVR